MFFYVFAVFYTHLKLYEFCAINHKPTQTQNKMPKTNYQLHLKGYVGGWDFDSNYVDYILGKNKDKPVNVLIDSTGGSLATALSIVAAFKNHGDVSVHFVGMNASAATIASLGANKVTIDSSAMYLVHKCSSGFFQYGSFNADQLSNLIEQCEQMKNDLDKMDANVASMYANKCKKSPEDLLALMKKGGWLTASEALEWGFVDEVTDYEEDDAPVLTEAVVASMNSVGMPVPNMPLSSGSVNEAGMFSRFLTALTSFFSQPKPAEPEDRENVLQTQTNDKTITMNKNFMLLATLLSLEAFEEKNGCITLSTEQMQKIEDAIKNKNGEIKTNSENVVDLKAKIKDLETSADAKDKEITDLKSQVEALKSSPGESTRQVVDEKKDDTIKSDVEKYYDSMKSARELYDMLP